MNRTVMAMTCAAALTGCVNLSGLDATNKFSCKATEGILCSSMSGIYDNARQNNLPGQIVNRGDKGDDATTADKAELSRAKVAATGLPVPPDSGMAIRSAPRILRVMFFPWEDNDGDLHDGSYVYLTVDTGRWLIEHNRKRIRDSFAPSTPMAPAASAAGNAAESAKDSNSANKNVALTSPGEFAQPSSFNFAPPQGMSNVSSK